MSRSGASLFKNITIPTCLAEDTSVIGPGCKEPAGRAFRRGMISTTTQSGAGLIAYHSLRSSPAATPPGRGDQASVRGSGPALVLEHRRSFIDRGNGSGSSGKTMSQGSSRPLTVAVPPTQQQRGLGGRAEVRLASRGVMNCPNGTTTKHEIPRSISDRQPTTTRRQSRMAHRLVRKSGGSIKAFATDILRDWIPSTAAKPLECGV